MHKEREQNRTNVQRLKIQWSMNCIINENICIYSTFIAPLEPSCLDHKPVYVRYSVCMLFESLYMLQTMFVYYMKHAFVYLSKPCITPYCPIGPFPVIKQLCKQFWIKRPGKQQLSKQNERHFSENPFKEYAIYSHLTHID